MSSVFTADGPVVRMTACEEDSSEAKLMLNGRGRLLVEPNRRAM